MKWSFCVLLFIPLVIGIVIGHGWQTKSFEDKTIYFFLGGSKQDPFAKLIEEGVREAQRQLGCEVHFVWSDWDADLMVEQFLDVLSKRPDGVVIMGHPGDDKLASGIKEAFRKKIVVSSVNTPLTRLQEEFHAMGFGYVGQYPQKAGKDFAMAVMAQSSLKSGDEVIVLGVENMADRSVRTDCIRKKLSESGLEVNFMNIFPEDRKHVMRTFLPKFEEFLERHDQAKVIVIDDALIRYFPMVMESLRMDPNDYFVAGYDLYPENIPDIQDGKIDLVVDQQPFMQGYMALVQIAYSIQYNYRGLNIDTGMQVITQQSLVSE